MRLDFALAFFLILGSAAAQQQSGNPAKPQHDAESPGELMKTGVLAILADRPGSLYIDGQEGGKPQPGNVLALKLIAGQHFIEFRDSSGHKVWEKVVDIPSGSQIAEKISATPESGGTRREPPIQSSGGVPTAGALQPQQLYQTVNVQVLTSMLNSAGYDTQIDKDGDINFTVGGIKSWVHLYGCEQNECKSFGYVCGFKADPPVSLDLINEYARKKRWGRAYLRSDGSKGLSMDVGVDGGVSYQYLIRTLNIWRDVSDMFRNALVDKKVD